MGVQYCRIKISSVNKQVSVLEPSYLLKYTFEAAFRYSTWLLVERKLSHEKLAGVVCIMCIVMVIWFKISRRLQKKTSNTEPATIKKTCGPTCPVKLYLGWQDVIQESALTSQFRLVVFYLLFEGSQYLLSRRRQSITHEQPHAFDCRHGGIRLRYLFSIIIKIKTLSNSLEATEGAFSFNLLPRATLLNALLRCGFLVLLRTRAAICCPALVWHCHCISVGSNTGPNRVNGVAFSFQFSFYIYTSPHSTQYIIFIFSIWGVIVETSNGIISTLCKNTFLLGSVNRSSRQPQILISYFLYCQKLPTSNIPFVTQQLLHLAHQLCMCTDCKALWGKFVILGYIK